MLSISLLICVNVQKKKTCQWKNFRFEMKKMLTISILLSECFKMKIYIRLKTFHYTLIDMKIHRP